MLSSCDAGKQDEKEREEVSTAVAEVTTSPKTGTFLNQGLEVTRWIASDRAAPGLHLSI